MRGVAVCEHGLPAGAVPATFSLDAAARQPGDRYGLDQPAWLAAHHRFEYGLQTLKPCAKGVSSRSGNLGLSSMPPRWGSRKTGYARAVRFAGRLFTIRSFAPEKQPVVLALSRPFLDARMENDHRPRSHPDSAEGQCFRSFRGGESHQTLPRVTTGKYADRTPIPAAPCKSKPGKLSAGAYNESAKRPGVPERSAQVGCNTLVDKRASNHGTASGSFLD